MARRTSLPGAAELFRTTSADVEQAAAGSPAVTAVPADRESEPESRTASERADAPSIPVETSSVPARPGGAARSRSVRSTRRVRSAGDRTPTGRERHEEKITVYCSPEELLDLESARLTLRGEHGLAVDRGRIVREAVAVVLADLEAKGDASILVRRLRES